MIPIVPPSLALGSVIGLKQPIHTRKGEERRQTSQRSSHRLALSPKHRKGGTAHQDEVLRIELNSCCCQCFLLLSSTLRLCNTTTVRQGSNDIGLLTRARDSSPPPVRSACCPEVGQDRFLALPSTYRGIDLPKGSCHSQRQSLCSTVVAFWRQLHRECFCFKWAPWQPRGHPPARCLLSLRVLDVSLPPIYRSMHSRRAISHVFSKRTTRLL